MIYDFCKCKRVVVKWQWPVCVCVWSQRKTILARKSVTRSGIKKKNNNSSTSPPQRYCSRLSNTHSSKRHHSINLFYSQVNIFPTILISACASRWLRPQDTCTVPLALSVAASDTIERHSMAFAHFVDVLKWRNRRNCIIFSYSVVINRWLFCGKRLIVCAVLSVG